MDMQTRLAPWIIGFFLVTVALEALYSHYRRDGRYQRSDTWASLLSGVGNVGVNVGAKALIILMMYGLYGLSPLRIPMGWWIWPLALLGVDFCFYWAHRFGHESRLGWAMHVPHHNSRYYNLSTALRQSWTHHVLGLFYLPLPLLGFPPEVVVAMHMLDSLYQFWIHTEYIGRLPAPLEYVLNTPSHHRVHHGSDALYLDRNYGGVFILWDRWFGTFQQEQHRPQYGITENIPDQRLLTVHFYEWGRMLRDVWQAPNLRTALGYLWHKPGWKPAPTQIPPATAPKTAKPPLALAQVQAEQRPPR